MRTRTLSEKNLQLRKWSVTVVYQEIGRAGCGNSHGYE